MPMAEVFPGLLLDFSLRSLAAGAVFGVVLAVFRVRNTALRYGMWRMALATMLLLPLGSMVIPAIPVLPSSLKPETPRIQPRSELMNGSIRKEPIGSPAPASLPPYQTAPAMGSGVSWTLITLGAYLLITGILLLRIVTGWLIIRRAVRQMDRIDDWRLSERACRVSETLGFMAFPEFRSGANVAVPVTLGWINPIILLPEGWKDWPVEKLDFVLAHELSHVHRGDYLTRVLSAINKSLYWFHPFSWWVDRQLAELSEHLSDDAALLACSGARERYAAILQDFTESLAHNSSRLRRGIAMALSVPGTRRIQRILDQERALNPMLNPRQKFVLRGLAIPVLILVAGAQTVERPVRPEVTQTQPAGPSVRRAPRIRPPMFGAAYVEALRNVLEIEPADVAQLEARLAGNPDDFAARLRLIAYHRRADRAALPESLGRRADLILWLVENRPDSEILSSGLAIVPAADLTPAQWQRGSQAWEKAMRERALDARVMWNAANFYRELDRNVHLATLEKAVALAPDNENYALPLGLLYASAILQGDAAVAGRARQRLDSTQNAFLLEPAVRLFQSEYNSSLMRGGENVAVGELARRYFERAKAIDPGLDEAWIFPKMDPKMAGIFAPGARPPDDGRAKFDLAAAQIRRLPPDAFPNVPATIRGTLRLRGCLIPQPAGNDQPRNVIQGEFLTKGQTSWAALCSIHGASSILVFRDPTDTKPGELARAEDKSYLQGLGSDTIGYSRAIQTVDGKYITTHYRAFGGPQPPPIDHQGIDDAFVGKASVTHYWHKGAWLGLQGAD